MKTQQKGQYTRLSEYEREMIFRLEMDGLSCRAIGRKLERSPSTISRELRRGTDKKDRYCADCAHRRAQTSASQRRSGKYKLTAHKPLQAYVMEKLHQLWSPEQIAERLKQEYPEDTRAHITRNNLSLSVCPAKARAEALA